MYNSTKKYSIWQNDNWKIWFALALLIAGLALTCSVALYVKRGVESIARKEFDFACNEIKDKISTRIQQHAQILRSASAFFKVNGNITREQWHSAIARQNIEQVLPGIQGIGYAIIIPPDQLALHERKIRNEGFPQYAVNPAGKRDIYTSIIYLEPFSERNLRAFGYDMFSEPIRQKAMVHARDFDEAALSGKITLVQETDKDLQAGTLMYVPVYESELPLKTVEERRRAIRGWVYSPYRMNDLMRGILGNWESGEGKQIRLEVFDGTSFQADALLYDSRPGQKLELTSATIFNEQTSIPFKNHHWNLRFTQIGDLAGIVDYSKAWYVLIGGTLVNVLLFTLYFLLINASNRAQTLAEALTRELRESTDRKRAEEALKLSEEKYRNIFENSVEGIFQKTMEGRFITVNPVLAYIYGYSSPEEMIETITDIGGQLDVNPDDRNEFHRIIQEKGIITGFEVQQKRKDGSIFWASLNARSVYDARGKLLYYEGTIVDITERKHANEALMESEKKYNELAHFLPQIVFEADMKGNMTFVNQAAYSISGYSPEEFKRGLNVFQMLVPEDRDRARLNMQSILHSEESRSNEYTFLRKDGRTFPVITEVIPIVRNNQTLGLRGLVVNITERKQAEEKLKQQADAMEASADGIAILNEDQNYVYVNEAHARIYGYDTSEELIGKPWTVLYDEDELQRFDHEIMPELIRKGQWRGEAIGKKKDGSAFSQEVSLTGLDNGGLICVVRDITSRKHVEEHLKKTMEKLRKRLIGTIQALSSTVETRDPYTAGHQRRVSRIARTIAQEMGLPNDTVDTIRMAGIIHDIGKISVPAEILVKPGRISDIEMSLIKVHARSGYDILKDVELPYHIAEIVLQHHERLNGSGYPQGLKGDQILLEAQIISVADVVEAISSYRPYRPALGIEVALEEIEKNKGILYNEKAVEVCVRLFREKGFTFEPMES